MDPSTAMPAVLVAIIGGGFSYWLANRRIERLRRHAFHAHMQGMSALANVCIEIQCINYGASIEDAKKIFETTMQQSGMAVMCVERPVSQEARDAMAKQRAAYLASKEPTHVDTKSS